MVDFERLQAAYDRARADLLAAREPAGHWTGHLASSALSTATAISALSLVRSNDPSQAGELTPLIQHGLAYLASQQNADGGFGDTDLSRSNIATTMLARAAIHLAGATAEQASLLQRAEQYISFQGGLAGLRRRYGKDKTFAVPILTNCALAGLVPWKHVARLPFELACVPQRLYRFLRLPVVSYAIPALVAIGQAVHVHRGGRRLRPWREAARAGSLKVVERMQPDSGGFLEATPLTSFVVMSLASIGHARHPIVERGVRFLRDSIREDGSWPIDTNLATWNTTLALNALGAEDEALDVDHLLAWLLSCQHRERHAFTGADPGGWGWSDLSGAVPDADDTPGALLALAKIADRLAEEPHDPRLAQIDEAAVLGCRWLLGLQNRDGGWPTFCRGWGALPFDRSATDLTAHALRALNAWRKRWLAGASGEACPRERGHSARREHGAQFADVCPDFLSQVERAIARGLAYLLKSQNADGSWSPLWFGNQHRPDEDNPIYGTAKILRALAELELGSSPMARAARDWLVRAQDPSGGWGAAADDRLTTDVPCGSSVEETALAVEALTLVAVSEASETSRRRGLEWLVQLVEGGRHHDCQPIGFYFAKLWYYEKLYPLSFTVSALSVSREAEGGKTAVGCSSSKQEPVSAVTHSPVEHE